VAISLAFELLQKHPDLARRTAEAHAGTLGHLSSELCALLGNPTLHASSPDHAERRARMQTALHEWFLAFSRAEPLLLAVDNLQAADDNSAAFLAALGRRAKRERLVILVTQRTGDPVTSPLPVRALRKRSNNVKLGALSATACEELVQSLFGHVANSGRVAALLFERSADAMFVGTGAFTNSHRERIVALAARHTLPASYSQREAVVAGGLMGYGTSIPNAYRLAGIYAARILSGEKPANLPVMRSTRFEFLLNLKTAKMLGIDIPPTLLALADEVIE
jgi:putative ABC transport system substrate-binding protein